MEEWIKKSDAIKAIEALAIHTDERYLNDLEYGHNEGLAHAIDRIEDIPSADRPQGKWIPCSERMPEPGSWAIWCSIKGIIQVARWKEDAIDHFFPDQGFFDLEDAVAWMPLPKPWKGADDE